MMTRVCCDSLPCTTSSGTDAIEVGRTGTNVKVKALGGGAVAGGVQVGGHTGSAGAVTVTRTDWVPGGGWPKSSSERRRRAPGGAGLVGVGVVDEGEEAGRGVRRGVWSLVEWD